MGILNLTPDSFYDGGFYIEVPDIIERVLTFESSEGKVTAEVGCPVSTTTNHVDVHAL